MTPAFMLLLPAVASGGIGLTILDGAQPPDFVAAVQQFASQFATGAAAVLTSVNSAVIDIVRVAYVTCLLIGILLYFTHVGRRLGKDLMVGGVVLVVLGEYVIPALTMVSK